MTINGIEIDPDAIVVRRGMGGIALFARTNKGDTFPITQVETLQLAKKILEDIRRRLPDAEVDLEDLEATARCSLQSRRVPKTVRATDAVAEVKS